jgi:hypothetical protein
MNRHPLISLVLLTCLALLCPAGAGAFGNNDGADGTGNEANLPGQVQFASIIIDGLTLTGPNSNAHRRDGRILVPVPSIARVLGYTVSIDTTARSVAVRRQNGSVADFDSRLGQVRENGSLVLTVSASGELVFSPFADELLLPAEIAAALFDVSIRYDTDKNAVIVSRGTAGDVSEPSSKNGRSLMALYQVDYQYDLNRFSKASSQNVVLTGVGRLADGRFTFSSNTTFSPNHNALFRNGTFTLERPNGQRFTGGDFGAGASLQFLTTNVRGGSASLPAGPAVISVFGGRTYSGSALNIPDLLNPNAPPIVTNRSFQYDTTVFGAFASTDSTSLGRRPNKFNFSGGAMHFSGASRSGDLVTGGFNYDITRFRMQADVGYGKFQGTRADGSPFSGGDLAYDVAGAVQVTDELILQGRYAHIGAKFISPQSGIREPIDLKAAGVSWSPVKWFSASVNASTSRSPIDQAQNNKYITAAFAFTPGRKLPKFYLSHTENSTSLIRSAAFTMLTASKDFTRFRVFLNATRTKTLGPATLNAQLGANFTINDTHSIEFSQGAGNRGAFNGQFDWRSSNLMRGRLSFTAGGGYNYDKSSGISAFERFTGSVALPRQTSLQVSFVQTTAGPTLMLSLRGSLFRKKEASTFTNSSAKEMNSFGKMSGRVYQDIDLNGKYDPGTDKPQAGVNVRVDGNRYVVSDENGVYEFDAIPSGEHRIYLDLLTVRADLTVLGGDARETDLEAGHNSILDFRLVRTGRITGRAWLDTNENGKFDEGETPLADVRVVTSSGRDTLTDSDGNFTIGDLAPGEHVVLLDEKTIPEKTMAGFKPLAITVIPGKESADNLLPVIAIPAEVKRFGKAK